MSLARTEEFEFDRKAWLRDAAYADGPHEGEWQYHSSDARFRVIIAGRRWGKSLSAAKEAEAMILTPGTRGWVVSKTYNLAWKVLREIYNDLIVRKRLEDHLVVNRSNPIEWRFSWGSTVEGKSAAHPESLLGEGLDWLIFDECAKCKQSIWELYLREALTDREGWALFITTPNGYNWIHDLYQRGKDPEHPDWQSFKSPSWENPYLSKEDIAEAKRTLSEAAFAQEYGADFTISTGQVYKEFDEAYHVIPANELILHPDWLRYRSIDFGYENPFVCLYIAVDPQDRVIVYDEYVQRHRTVERHAKALQDSKEYEATICDPSGATERATLADHGIYSIAYPSEIVEGLEAVRQSLKMRDDGKPGLVVSSQCKETIREFNLYSYRETGDLEKPMKEYDHCMDALRYFIVNWRKQTPRARVL